MGKFIDLTDRKFNRLSVISLSHKKPYIYWNVKCDCGNELKVIGSSFKSGRTKSCGCLHEEVVTKHNHWKTNIYKIWISMIGRCNNHKDKGYKNYGARGIKVCDKWLTFKGFYEDMGDKPEGMSVDRIDSDGDYCKENCLWATQKEQNNNRRGNVNITYNGKIQTLTQWAEELNINSSTLNKRINRSKWTIEKALTTNKYSNSNPSKSTGFNIIIARGITNYVAK